MLKVLNVLGAWEVIEGDVSIRIASKPTPHVAERLIADAIVRRAEHEAERRAEEQEEADERRLHEAFNQERAGLTSSDIRDVDAALGRLRARIVEGMEERN